jgi:hypothetical protein
VQFDVINNCDDIGDFVISVERQGHDRISAVWYTLCIVGLRRVASNCSCRRVNGGVQSCQLTDVFRREMLKYRLRSEVPDRLEDFYFNISFVDHGLC